jgi:geranylgeranyl pyrophosphate synthase
VSARGGGSSASDSADGGSQGRADDGASAASGGSPDRASDGAPDSIASSPDHASASGASSPDRAADWWQASARWAEDQLDRHAPTAAGGTPASLADAMRYALMGGGKRLRPCLVRLFTRASGGTDTDASRPAAAIEMVHTYSLIHDDLPCMDDDDLRRGRPTLHVVHGEALAVLAGDALLTHAFELLAECTNGAPMAGALARAAGPAGMVGGQVLDLSLAGSESSREDVELVHRLKTAALLSASCELGALAAGGSAEARAAAREYGQALGLLFQVVDDLLDVTGDSGTLGKTPGKDAALDRATMVAVLGVEGARGEAQRLAERARGAAESLGGAERELALGLVGRVLRRKA